MREPSLKSEKNSINICVFRKKWSQKKIILNKKTCGSVGITLLQQWRAINFIDSFESFSTFVNPTELIRCLEKSINLLSRTLIRSELSLNICRFLNIRSRLVLFPLVNRPKQIGISTAFFFSAVQVDPTATVNIKKICH